MSNQQLQESFEYCKTHEDPDALEALAAAYLEKGYTLNAAYCLRQAELAQNGIQITFEA